jgi:hypothetical protein
MADAKTEADDAAKAVSEVSQNLRGFSSSLSKLHARQETVGEAAAKAAMNLEKMIASVVSVNFAMKAIGSASPEAMNSFNTTIKMAVMMVGMSLMPIIVKLTIAFQKLLPFIVDMAKNAQNPLGALERAQHQRMAAEQVAKLHAEGKHELARETHAKWAAHFEGRAQPGKPGQPSTLEQQKGKIWAEMQDVMKETQGKFNVRKEAAPQFTQVEEARKQIQIDALKFDPLEQALMRLERLGWEMFQIEQQIANKTVPGGAS